MQLGTTAVAVALLALQVSADLVKRAPPNTAPQASASSDDELFFDSCLVRIKDRGSGNSLDRYWSHLHHHATPGGNVVIDKMPRYRFVIKTSEDCNYFKVLEYEVGDDTRWRKDTWEVEISPDLVNPRLNHIPKKPRVPPATALDPKRDFDACSVRIKKRFGRDHLYPDYWSSSINFGVPGGNTIIDRRPDYYFKVKTSKDCQSFKVVEHQLGMPYAQREDKWTIEVKPIVAFDTFPRTRAPARAQ